MRGLLEHERLSEDAEAAGGRKGTDPNTQFLKHCQPVSPSAPQALSETGQQNLGNTSLVDQCPAKAERVRFVPNAMIKSVRRGAAHCRGQLDDFASGGDSQVLGMLHQQLAHAAPARLPVDGQCGDAHDRLLVLQHVTQM
jgi:hypothetical protein